MKVLMGKSSVNGPFSIAMLNYQRVRVFFFHNSYVQWSESNVQDLGELLTKRGMVIKPFSYGLRMICIPIMFGFPFWDRCLYHIHPIFDQKWGLSNFSCFTDVFFYITIASSTNVFERRTIKL